MRAEARFGRMLVLVGILVAVVGLSGCDIVVNGDTGTTTDDASMRVVPRKIGTVDAVEIRVRNCNDARFISGGVEMASLRLRVFARVTDANGGVLFDNSPPPADSTLPGPSITGGSLISDRASGDLPDTITVPVAKAALPVHISAGCTNRWTWRAPSYTFTLPGCSTSHRTCAARRGGVGELVDHGI